MRAPVEYPVNVMAFRLRRSVDGLWEAEHRRQKPDRGPMVATRDRAFAPKSRRPACSLGSARLMPVPAASGAAAKKYGCARRLATFAIPPNASGFAPNSLGFNRLLNCESRCGRRTKLSRNSSAAYGPRDHPRDRL